MKRVLWSILCFALLISLFAAGGNAFAEEPVSEGIISPYAYAAGYVAAHPRRDAYSGAEIAAGQTLCADLNRLGFSAYIVPSQAYAETQNGKTVSYEYSHVIGKKDNGKDKTILIGCFYGGYEPTDSYGVGEGASAALSVGLTMCVAQALVSRSLDYNITIAFWGGMEVSSDVDAEKCGLSYDDVALYVNFDCVAAGAYDYLYADDLPRSQEKYFRTIIEEQGAQILSAPAYKKPASFAVSGSTYTYLHLGLMGANRSFMEKKVPCVSFVGGAWEHDNGLYRYPGKGDIEGGPLDTLAEIDKMNGAKEVTEGRLLSVATVVIAGLCDERLPAVLEQAAAETSGVDLDSDVAYYVILFVGLGGVIAFLLFLMFKQKKDRRDEIWEPSFTEEKTDFSDPYEELNGEGEQTNAPSEPPSDEDDGDDVFRF